MRKFSCYVAAFLGLGLFALCGSAHALTFSVSDINFTAEGNNEGFTWVVSSAEDISFNLNAGEKRDFQYGTFTALTFTQDDDVDDWLQVDFVLTPPDAADRTTVKGEVVASVGKKNNFIDINFTEYVWIDVAFDDGGLYKIMFWDIVNGKVKDDREVYPLMASINYTTAPTPIPNPEPSTMVLLGSGLLGLVYVARKKRRQ